MKQFLLLALASMSILALKAEAAPVGMAAHVTGKVTMSSDGTQTPLRLLSRLEDGATISCGPASNAVIVLFGSGQRFEVGAGKTASVHAAAVQGGVRLAELSGPSASAVKLLGSARVGAASSRKPQSLQRLVPDSPGYIDSAAPRFNWTPVTNASRYRFTLFDENDNVVRLVTTNSPGFTYGTETEPLAEKRPYLWTLSVYGASGKMLTDTRGGLITLLSTPDALALETLANDLKNQAKTATDDTPTLILAEVYRSYGVTGRTLEILDDVELNGNKGAAAAKADIYASLSPFTRAVAGPSAELPERE